MNWMFWKKPIAVVDHSAMKLGKAAARRDPRTLALCTYTAKLQPAMESCNLTGAMTKIGMMLNDSLGDCTCAAAGHVIQQWTAENGKQVIISDADILAAYEAVGGYDPSNPETDQGAVELDVLKYWQKNGIGGHTIDAFVYINSKSKQELMNSVYYFGSAYIGVQLPLAAQTQEIWSVVNGSNGAIGSWGGHAIPIVAYDVNFVYCITWGQIKKMTWDFYMRYVDEAYALLSPDWFNERSTCPLGFDLSALTADLQLVGSS